MYKRGAWGRVSVQVFDMIDTDVLEYIAEHDDNLQECIRLSARAKSIAPQPILATLLHFGCVNVGVLSSDIAGWFVSSLANGENINKGDAVYHLRTRLMAQTRHAHMSNAMKRFLMTIAWNKTVKGESCTSAVLRLRTTGPTKQQPPSKILAIHPEDELQIQ
jgi:hypothetical protein